MANAYISGLKPTPVRAKNEFYGLVELGWLLGEEQLGSVLDYYQMRSGEPAVHFLQVTGHALRFSQQATTSRPLPGAVSVIEVPWPN